MIRDILWINSRDMMIYHTGGVLILQDKEKFNTMVLEEKNKIAQRDYVLNRFEPWEVDTIRSLKMLLVGRAKNSQEKNLVHNYIEHLLKDKENI